MQRLKLSDEVGIMALQVYALVRAGYNMCRGSQRRPLVRQYNPVRVCVVSVIEFCAFRGIGVRRGGIRDRRSRACGECQRPVMLLARPFVGLVFGSASIIP